MRINGNILQEMLDNVGVMEPLSFFKKYIDIIDDKKWREKIQKAEHVSEDTELYNELKSILNKSLFLTIPNENDLMNRFANIVFEDSIDMFGEFTEFYQELENLKKQEFDKVRFKECSSEVQLRALNSEIHFSDYEQYFDIANIDVQDKVFENVLENGGIFQHQFKNSRNYIEHKNKIETIINQEMEGILDLSDIIGSKEVLNRCSSHILKKLPDDSKYEFIEIFTKKYEEIIKNENLNPKQLEESLTGEELLELLSQNNFEQKKGEVYHLNFDTTKIDLQKLIDVSQKYKISCSLVIESSADLPINSIEIITKHFGIDIKEVRFKQDDLNEEQQIPYSIEDYINCRNIIDAITNDVEEEAKVMPNDQNRDKKICGIVVRRLANLIRYNHEYIHKSDMKQTSKEEDIINRNMIGGLLNGICVCAGYAEILRNVLLCCGIECRYVSADNREKEESGHAWNQVKLDGKWYNIDLTWDADRIVAGQPTKYFLKSDNDFGHTKFIIRKLINKCADSIPNAHQYMRYRSIDQNVNFNKLLRRAIVTKGITQSEANEYSKVASAQENDIVK